MSQVPSNSPAENSQDGKLPGPAPLHWGDANWGQIVSKELDAVQAALDVTSRGGEVFRQVVASWKSGKKLASNLELARRLSWGDNKSHVSEGFRTIREYLDARTEGALRIRVQEWTRKLIVEPRTVETAQRMILVAIPEAEAALLGELTLGTRAAGLRLETSLITGPADEIRQLDASDHLYRLILPTSLADEAGAYRRLAGGNKRTVLLDSDVAGADLPLVTFDYAGAGLYCAQKLVEYGARDVFVLARRPDSRARAMEQGVRRLEEGRETLYLEPSWLADTATLVREKIEQLHAHDLATPGRKLGIVCANAEVGLEVLRFLAAAGESGLRIAVAVVGGQPWNGPHWVEYVWVELNYKRLAEHALSVLRDGAAPAPIVPAYVTRKPPVREVEMETAQAVSV